MVDSSTHDRPVLRQARPPRRSPTPAAAAADQQVVAQPIHDRRRLTYSNTFDSAWKRNAIRAIEWVTGKITILRMLREYQRREAPTRATFWHVAMDIMGIDIQTPADQRARIPRQGPVIIVANHPHGLVDGLVIADIVSDIRLDFKILSRAILTGIDETAASFMIAVPFQHEEDAQRKGIEMRAAAMAQLDAGGMVVLFPSGVVAASDTMFGDVVEAEWNVFTAKMIRRSGATVVPMFFPGANSRWYQIANRISATLRQGLLLHEIVAACNKPQRPVIGRPVPKGEIAERIGDPRAFMSWLRDRTLRLKDDPDL